MHVEFRNVLLVLQKNVITIGIDMKEMLQMAHTLWLRRDASHEKYLSTRHDDFCRLKTKKRNRWLVNCLTKITKWNLKETYGKKAWKKNIVCTFWPLTWVLSWVKLACVFPLAVERTCRTPPIISRCGRHYWSRESPVSHKSSFIWNEILSHSNTHKKIIWQSSNCNAHSWRQTQGWDVLPFYRVWQLCRNKAHVWWRDLEKYDSCWVSMKCSWTEHLLFGGWWKYSLSYD